MGDGRVVVAEVGRSALAAAREIAVPGGWATAVGETVAAGVGKPAERANRMTAGELAQPGGKPVPAGGAPEPANVEDGTPRRMLAMDPADHVLVVTSRFRFLLISWRQLQSYGDGPRRPCSGGDQPFPLSAHQLAPTAELWRTGG
jgi:hypothetical protein